MTKKVNNKWVNIRVTVADISGFSDNCQVNISGESCNGRVIYKYKNPWQFLKDLIHGSLSIKYRTSQIEISKRTL